jgi:hypothetical protein
MILETIALTARAYVKKTKWKNENTNMKIKLTNLFSIAILMNVNRKTNVVSIQIHSTVVNVELKDQSRSK